MKIVMCGWEMVFILLFVMITAASAELYQYVNESGAVSFTDDLSKIPMEKRPQVKVIKTVKDSSPPLMGKVSPSEDTALSPAILRQEAKELKQKNEALKEEYARIQDEKKRLSDLRHKLQAQKRISKSELTSFNHRVLDVNNKIKQYTVNLKAHEERTKVYNLKAEKFRGELVGGEEE